MIIGIYGGMGQAEPVPEYDMKAIFLYNFALFTEWPAESNDRFNLCILGRDPFGASLDAIETKSINGVRINVMRISTLANAKKCHMLFFTESEFINSDKLFQSLRDTPVLTITDNENISSAIIRLRLDNNHLSFDINNEIAQRNHLVISSKLLRLAHAVK